MPQIVNGISVKPSDDRIVQKRSKQKGGILAKNHLKITAQKLSNINNIYSSPNQHIRQINLAKQYEKNRAIKGSYRDKIDKLQK